MSIRSAAAAAAVAAVVIAAPATASGGENWSVTGTGVGSGAVAGDSLQLGAQSSVGGLDPRGHAQNVFSLNDAQYNDGGPIVCLNVVGNRASVVWQLRQPIVTATRTFLWGAALIEDNGEPVAGHPVDRMLDFALSVEAGNLGFFCSANPLFLLDVYDASLASGNFVIQDS